MAEAKERTSLTQSPHLLEPYLLTRSAPDRCCACRSDGPKTLWRAARHKHVAYYLLWIYVLHRTSDIMFEETYIMFEDTCILKRLTLILLMVQASCSVYSDDAVPMLRSHKRIICNQSRICVYDTFRIPVKHSWYTAKGSGCTSPRTYRYLLFQKSRRKKHKQDLLMMVIEVRTAAT